tara:strand:- start:592 stop:750 length:159 start_codon:yes stop_codon:yes gene_type:complete
MDVIVKNAHVDASHVNQVCVDVTPGAEGMNWGTPITLIFNILIFLAYHLWMR